MPRSERAVLAGFGSAAPAKILTNADLEAFVDTSDEWIRTRTGIQRRHVASDGETTLTFAAEAARKALADSGTDPAEIDLIILGTISPDLGFPATACLLQDAIGARNAAALDISAACSGFIYGLHLADATIRAGSARTVLLVGAETMSRIINWHDRNTCVPFRRRGGCGGHEGERRPRSRRPRHLRPVRWVSGGDALAGRGRHAPPDRSQPAVPHDERQGHVQARRHWRWETPPRSCCAKPATPATTSISSSPTRPIPASSRRRQNGSTCRSRRSS